MPQQCQGQGSALLLLSLQASFLSPGSLPPQMSMAVSMPALALPKPEFREGEMCFQLTLTRAEKSSSHKTCLSRGVADVGPAADPTPVFSCKNNSCIQAQSCSPFAPSIAPPNSTSQHPCSGCCWPQAGITVPQLRTELAKPPRKASSAALLCSPFSSAAHTRELRFFPGVPSCSIPRLRAGIGMQITHCCLRLR